MPASLPPGLRDALAAYRRRLEERFGDALLELRLFGSYATGRADEESAVDVFVVLRQAGRAERRDAIDLATDVMLETDFHVSPTVMDASTHRLHRRQERPLVMDVEREGIAI